MSRKTKQENYVDGFKHALRWIDGLLADLGARHRDFENAAVESMLANLRGIL